MLKKFNLPNLGWYGANYVTVDYRFRDIYWKEMTQRVRTKLGTGHITRPDVVRSMLDELLAYVLEQFQRVSEKGRSLGFLLFVHTIHETSVPLVQLALHEHPDVLRVLDEEERRELPGVRRVLKLLMEELLPAKVEQKMSTDLPERAKPTRQNVVLLEELLYLGIQALTLKEFINSSVMSPEAVVIVSSWKKMLSIVYAFPYNKLLWKINEDIAEYPNVEYESMSDELDVALEKDFGTSLTHFLSLMPDQAGSGLIPREDFLNELGYSGDELELLRPFCAGLTLSAANKLPLQESFKKTQQNARLLYRPILEFNDRDDNTYWLVGRAKTIESKGVLQTNAMLWGELPQEWLSGQHFQQFVADAEQKREATMVCQIAELLDQHELVYDTSVKYLLDERGMGVSLQKKDLGEIDIIILDQVQKRIWVCECKNNRPRHEVFYWLSEHRYFVKNYEPKLTRKHIWISEHVELVQSHFEHKKGVKLDLTGWTVEGLFLLMTPSFYKYDGLFLTLTVRDLEEFLENDFTFDYPVFRYERKDRSIGEIKYPYFKNLHRLAASGEL